MQRFAALALTALALTACQDSTSPAAGPSPEDGPQASRAPELIPDQNIDMLRRDATDVRARGLSLARSHGARIGPVFRHAIQGFVGNMSAAAAREMARDPSVEYVEQDQVMRVSTVQTGVTWGLDRIDQRTLPLSGTFTYTRTGAGVKAYIVDTGILLTHTEFAGRAVTGHDAVTAGGTATDCNGHGTHVAGTVGGSTYGVAKGVSLVGVRVLGCDGSGTNSGVIAGVDWVTGNHQAGEPAVANMSLGGGASTALDDAVRRSIADGVTYGLAAGNGFLGLFAQNACNGSPSRVLEGITVSATDSTDKKPSWANTGTCVDIFAPGVNIKSSWFTSTTATNTISGTSMATPHVVGVAALYLEGNPTATPAAVQNALIADATTGKVLSPGSGSPNRLLYTAY